MKIHVTSFALGMVCISLVNSAGTFVKQFAVSARHEVSEVSVPTIGRTISAKTLLYSPTKDERAIEPHDLATPFCSKDSVAACVVQICHGDSSKREFYVSQGIMYAQTENAVYIALPKHCLPKLTIDYAFIVTNNRDTLDIKKRCIDAICYDSIDAAMLVLSTRNLGSHYLSVSEMELIDNRMLCGDSAIMETMYDCRNVIAKYGTLNDSSIAAFTLFRAEPGDSGSPLIGRYGVIGLVSNSFLGNGNSQYVPIAYFEHLYIISRFKPI